MIAFGVIIAALLDPAGSFQPGRQSTIRQRTRLSSSTQQGTTTATAASDKTWRPTVSSLSDRRSYFREQSRHNAEALGTLGFHHVEFYAGDALTTAKRFELALGMPITCWSSLATGNDVCVTYLALKHIHCKINFEKVEIFDIAYPVYSSSMKEVLETPRSSRPRASPLLSRRASGSSARQTLDMSC